MKPTETKATTPENLNNINSSTHHHEGFNYMNAPDAGRGISQSLLTFFSVFTVGVCILLAFYVCKRSKKRRRRTNRRSSGSSDSYQYSKLTQFDNHEDDELETEVIYDVEDGAESSSSSVGDPEEKNNDPLMSLGASSSTIHPSNPIPQDSVNENDPATLPVSSTTTNVRSNGSKRMSQSSMFTESDEELIR
eukprot:TRINITY_DN14601_c0_g1_i1.p1 TRINITY_DN14601_c0_g1~~TRINITY_DN14601_c0_g1_i1.p1  ORF type:complete len:192 (+),score=54.50 TRINITY_DN14601_c0_g1_i1:140-715(+)